MSAANPASFRAEDREAFMSIARSEQVWILVRETNPSSLREYAGRNGYTSKPITCKAKTADADPQTRGNYKLAGLVISPEIWAKELGHLYKADKSAGAIKLWNEFKSKLHAGSDYDVDTDEKSPHYGCVRLKGEYVYGDYDLFDIVLANQERRNLAAVETLQGEPHLRGPRFFKVQQLINARLGFAMIHHGGAAQYFKEWEPVHVFDPNGQYHQWSANETKQKYEEWKRAALVFNKDEKQVHTGHAGWKPQVIPGGRW